MHINAKKIWRAKFQRGAFFFPPAVTLLLGCKPVDLRSFERSDPRACRNWILDLFGTAEMERNRLASES